LRIAACDWQQALFDPDFEAQLTVRSRCRSQSPSWARPQATAAALTGTLATARLTVNAV